MKRSRKILAVALLATAVIAGGGMINSTLASQDAEKLAAKTATEYASGVTQGNMDKVLKHVKDTRFQDETTKKQKYEKYGKENRDRHTEMKFVELEKIDDNKFNATFKMSSDEFNATTFKLPIIIDNGEWKVFVDGSLVVDMKK